MADDKATSLDVTKPRRRIEFRDLALAVQPLQKRQRNPLSPPENVAKPWKKPWDK
jgi:hypothetical protein